MNQFQINLSTLQAKERLEKALENSETMQLKRFSNNSFYIHSKRKYGSQSMIEKEYYSIRGKLKKQNQTTIVEYKVAANSTYRTLLYIIPLMLLPTVFFIYIGDRSNLTTGIGLFFLIFGVAAFFLIRIDRKLRRGGERDFERMLKGIRFLE